MNKHRPNMDFYYSTINKKFVSTIATISEKDSKVNYEKMLKKYLKNLCRKKDSIPFSIATILSITCSLDSGNNILHLMP